MYDLIGDIHGHADELVELLHLLGYTEQAGVFRHPSRQIVYCGDFIDRGPRIRDVLKIVRCMVEDRAAPGGYGESRIQRNRLSYGSS